MFVMQFVNVEHTRAEMVQCKIAHFKTNAKFSMSSLHIICWNEHRCQKQYCKIMMKTELMSFTVKVDCKQMAHRMRCK